MPRDTRLMTARREDLDLAPIFGYEHPEMRDGVWVARLEDGTYVDYSRYRNDLLSWYPNLVIIVE